MAGQELMARLNEVFCEVFEDDRIKISDAMTAKDVDGWDSVTHITLVVAIERAFGVRFTTIEIMDLKNVGEFADLLERKLAAPKP